MQKSTFYIFDLLFSLYSVQECISVGSTSTPLPNTQINDTHTSLHSKYTHSPSRIHSSSSLSPIHHSSQHSITDSPCSRERSWIIAELSDKSNFEPKNLLSLFDEATLESKPWVVNATLLLVYSQCLILNCHLTFCKVMFLYVGKHLKSFKPGLIIGFLVVFVFLLVQVWHSLPRLEIHVYLWENYILCKLYRNFATCFSTTCSMIWHSIKRLYGKSINTPLLSYSLL